jgi:hypothetical protein
MTIAPRCSSPPPPHLLTSARMCLLSNVGRSRLEAIQPTLLSAPPRHNSRITGDYGLVGRFTLVYGGADRQAPIAVRKPHFQRGDAHGGLELSEQAIALGQFHETPRRLALQSDHALGAMRRTLASSA